MPLQTSPKARSEREIGAKSFSHARRPAAKTECNNTHEYAMLPTPTTCDDHGKWIGGFGAVADTRCLCYASTADAGAGGSGP